MKASAEGHVASMQLLLDRGAQVNHQDKDGRTPLMEALSEGHVECVRLLLDKGAPVDHQDNVSAVGCLTNDMLLSCSLWHKYIL
eukprot:Em0001g419a